MGDSLELMVSRLIPECETHAKRRQDLTKGPTFKYHIANLGGGEVRGLTGAAKDGRWGVQ